MIICLCRGITEKDLESCLSPNEPILEKIQNGTGAGTDCGSCLRKIQAYVELQKAQKPMAVAEPNSFQCQSSE